MEERYDFKFANEKDKEKMLFLSEIETDKSKKGKIPKEENKDILE